MKQFPCITTHRSLPVVSASRAWHNCIHPGIHSEMTTLTGQDSPVEESTQFWKQTESIFSSSSSNFFWWDFLDAGNVITTDPHIARFVSSLLFGSQCWGVCFQAQPVKGNLSDKFLLLGRNGKCYAQTLIHKTLPGLSSWKQRWHHLGSRLSNQIIWPFTSEYPIQDSSATKFLFCLEINNWHITKVPHWTILVHMLSATMGPVFVTWQAVLASDPFRSGTQQPQPYTTCGGDKRVLWVWYGK